MTDPATARAMPLAQLFATNVMFWNQNKRAIAYKIIQKKITSSVRVLYCP